MQDVVRKKIHVQIMIVKYQKTLKNIQMDQVHGHVLVKPQMESVEKYSVVMADILII